MKIKIPCLLFLLLFTSHLFAALSTPISTCNELMNMTQGDYVLTKNIDCSGVDFIPIGTVTNPFTGSLNGAGNTISNLTSELFGYLSNAKISRVILDKVQILQNSSSLNRGTLADVASQTIIESVFSHGQIKIESAGAVGGLVGVLQNNSLIKQSLSTVNVHVISNNATASVGGLVGKQQNNATIRNSVATGTVTGFSNVGGLTGALGNGGMIESSYATGQVSTSIKGDNQNLGGLVGLISPLDNSELKTGVFKSYATGDVNINEITGTGIGGLIGMIAQGKLAPSILDSYATGNIAGAASVGGLIGGNKAPRLHVSTSYASGKVIAPLDQVGGLIGPPNYASSDYTVIYNSYWDIEKSGLTTSVGGFGKNTQEMFQKNAYVNWNFSTIWKIEDEKDYPRLLMTQPLFSEIKTCGDLQAINDNLNGYYFLAADIDCSDINFIPIGNSLPFMGVLNGNGHTVSNLTINLPKQTEVGLFASTNSAAITNIIFKNMSVTGSIDVGAIVGNAANTQITGVYSDGKIVGKHYSSGAVGGLIGSANNSLIANSRSIADVEGVNINYVGGLIGYVYTTTQIINSYTKGYVLGSRTVGGIAGFVVNNNLAVSNVYSASSLLSTCSLSQPNCIVGGIVGSNNTSLDVHDNYYDKEISIFINSKLGIGKTTAEMFQRNTYRNWDFDTIWQIDNEANYPRLKDELN